MSDWTCSVDGPIAALANRWIIDYFTRVLWRHFEEDNTGTLVDWIESLADDRSGLIQDEVLLDHLELQNRLLIRFMCRMSSCATEVVIVRNDGGGGSGEGWTEMEEAIDLVERIVSVGNHGLSAKELLRIRLSIRQQAVYACCREGNFDLAAKVFFRQWKTWDTDEEMEARRDIAQILDSRNHAHELLSAMPFKATLRDCKTFLRKIFARMSPPFLITAAKNVWEQMNCGEGVRSADADALVKRVKREKIDIVFGDFEQQQRSINSSDVLVNEVCSLKGNVPNRLQIPPGPNQPTVQRPSSERTVTILSEARKEQTYPLLLWTNSISPESVTSTEHSAGVYRLNDVQPRVGPEFVRPQRAVTTADPGLFLGVNSNQFSAQKDIYFNTVPVVCSRVYTNTSLIQDSGNLFEKCGRKEGSWSVQAGVTKNVSTVQDSAALITIAEPNSICRLKPQLSQNSKYKPQDVIDVEADELTSKERVLGKELVPSSKQKHKRFRGSFNSPTIQAIASLSTASTKNFSDNNIGQKKMINTRNSSKITSANRGVDAVLKKSPMIRLEKINRYAIGNLLKTGRSEHVLRTRSYIAPVGEHMPSRSNTAGSLPKEKLTAATGRSGSSAVLPSTGSIQNSRNSDTISVKDNQSSPSKNRNKSPDSIAEKQNSITMSKSSGPRLRIRWSLDEEETLYRAVQVHGPRWKHISQILLTNRTPLDLAGKWVNLKKRLTLFEKRFGPVKKY